MLAGLRYGPLLVSHLRFIIWAWATVFGIGAPPMTDSSSDGDGRSNEPANEPSETSSEVADNEDLLCLI